MLGCNEGIVVGFIDGNIEGLFVCVGIEVGVGVVIWDNLDDGIRVGI